LVKVISLNFSSTDGEKEVCTVQELKENTTYSRGNHRDFTSFLQKQTNQDNPKVLSMAVLLLVAGLSEVASCWLLHNLIRPLCWAISLILLNEIIKLATHFECWHQCVEAN